MSIEQLKAEILASVDAKIKEWQETQVKPALEVGKVYYYIDDCYIEVSKWDNDSYAHKRLNKGNVFLTEQDALDEVKYRKLCHRLLKYTRGEYGNNNKYYLNFNSISNFLKEDWCASEWFCGKIHFPTPSARQAAIKELTPEEWKFYFSYQSKAVVM